MTDIRCYICNEPWDSYGLMNCDVKAWEADAIKSGDGCPCCKSNGFENLELYIKPEPELIGHCYICMVGIEIDQDEYIYCKNIKTFNDPDADFGFVHLNDNLCCTECAKEMTRCYECGKWVHEDSSYYIQDMNVVRCEDCMDDITVCTNCSVTDSSSEMRFVDSKPYCSCCYGPDLEIQNESD